MHQASLVTISGLVNQLLLPNSETKSPYWKNRRVMLYKDMPRHLQHIWQVSSGSGPNTGVLHVDNTISPQAVANQAKVQQMYNHMIIIL